MSTILVPYISQKHIDHKYFLYKKLPNGQEWYRTMTCGIYPTHDMKYDLDFSLIFELILLYEQIVITKEDFLYLTTKIDVGFLKELMEDGIIKLIDTESFKFGYSEKNNKLTFMTDSGVTNIGYSNRMNDLSGSIITQIERSMLGFENKSEFIEKVINESNLDIKKSLISKYINLSDTTKNNDIYNHNYRANQVFYMNYFYGLQARLNAEYLYQDKVIYELLKKKTASYIREGSTTVEEGFREILKLEDVLDINRLVLSNRIKLSELLELREHKDCKKFRDWLTSKISKGDVDSYEVLKAYHHACISKGKIDKALDSTFYKTINTATSIGLGCIPIAGGIYTFFDNFKGYILKDWKPNCFINDIKHMTTVE